MVMTKARGGAITAIMVVMALSIISAYTYINFNEMVYDRQRARSLNSIIDTLYEVTGVWYAINCTGGVLDNDDLVPKYLPKPMEHPYMQSFRVTVVDGALPVIRVSLTLHNAADLGDRARYAIDAGAVRTNNLIEKVYSPNSNRTLIDSQSQTISKLFGDTRCV